MSHNEYLNRREAAEYVSRKGLKISHNTLQKFATVGGGPIYRRFGNKSVYIADDLDAWIAKKLKPMRSTSVALNDQLTGQ